MTINPNSPAFRTDTQADYGSLTVRAELAARAMQGMLSHHGGWSSVSSRAEAAERSVAMADALIAALNRSTP